MFCYHVLRFFCPGCKTLNSEGAFQEDSGRRCVRFEEYGTITLAKSLRPLLSSQSRGCLKLQPNNKSNPPAEAYGAVHESSRFKARGLYIWLPGRTTIRGTLRGTLISFCNTPRKPATLRLGVCPRNLRPSWLQTSSYTSQHALILGCKCLLKAFVIGTLDG